jgi:hypothetical protein
MQVGTYRQQETRDDRRIYIPSHFEICGELPTFDLGVRLQRRLKYVKEGQCCLYHSLIPTTSARVDPTHNLNMIVMPSRRALLRGEAHILYAAWQDQCFEGAKEMLC